MDDTKKETETLQQEIASLKQQVATLEKALLLVGGRGVHTA
jgi:DNA anti-recombination protein RmuC